MSDLETIELTIEQAKKAITDAECLDRLNKNADFKRIVLAGFFNDYAVNLVYLLSDPTMQEDSDQRDLLKDIESVGRVRQYLSSIYQRSRIAQKELRDGEEERSEILTEDVH